MNACQGPAAQIKILNFIYKLSLNIILLWIKLVWALSTIVNLFNNITIQSALIEMALCNSNRILICDAAFNWFYFLLAHLHSHSSVCLPCLAHRRSGANNCTSISFLNHSSEIIITKYAALDFVPRHWSQTVDNTHRAQYFLQPVGCSVLFMRLLGKFRRT